MTNIDEDPRKIREPYIFGRLRNLVYDELCHEAWGCMLYRLNRGGHLGRDGNSLVVAANEYIKQVNSHHYFQTKDPDQVRPEGKEFLLRQISSARVKFEDATELLGLRRKVIDPLLFDEIYPASEAEKKVARDGLTLLSHFYNTGRRTNRVHA